MLYLAAPYTHEDPKVVDTRFEMTAKAAGWLLERNHQVFAPTVYGHIVEAVSDFGGPSAYDMWIRFGLTILSLCDELYVLKLPGWEESKGVEREVQEATKRGMPVTYINWDGEEVLITDRKEGAFGGVIKDRLKAYGPIEETAARFLAMAGIKDDPLAYYRQMIYAKLARMEGSGNRTDPDSWKDIGNYAHAAWEEC